MSDIISLFKSAIIDAGLVAPKDIIADDEIQYYNTTKKDKAGRYRLQIYTHNGREYGRGWFGDWREGGSWVPWKSHQRFPTEVTERAKVDEVAHREKRKLEVIAATKAAAEEFRAGSEVPRDHWYIEAKRIAPPGGMLARINDKGTLVVAMRDNKTNIRNLQRIYQDKDGATQKRYIKGSTTKNLYAQVSGARESINIVEGMATGVSVAGITGNLTIIAFSAANLTAVARIMREKFPDTRIVIGGDPGKVGEEKAHLAALSVDGLVAIPPQENPNEEMDWNDCVCENGVDAAQIFWDSVLCKPGLVGKTEADEPLEAEPETLVSPPSGVEVPPIEEPLYVPVGELTALPVDWQDEIKVTREGTPVSCSINAKSYLNNHPDFAGLIGWSEFEYRLVFLEYPHWWDTAKKELPAEIGDNEVVAIMMQLQHLGMVKIRKGEVKDALFLMATNKTVHPLRDKLKSLSWDGKPRLDTWLVTMMGAKKNKINAAFGRKFCIGAIARIFKPGCKMDTMLIFEGAQGIGKSMAAEALSYGYFTDSHIDFNSRFAPLKIHGKWICEMAELTGIKKSEAEAAKSFISRPTDRYQAMYAGMVEYPRQQVFIGTTNTSDYLSDSTGNRRYWPVICTRGDIELILEERDQLWAEAVVAYREGEGWWLEGDVVDTAAKEQQERVSVHPWQARIEGYISTGQFQCVTVEEVLSVVIYKDQPASNLKPYDKRDVARALRNMGWDRIDGVRISSGPADWGDRPRAWVHRDTKCLKVGDVLNLKMAPEYNLGGSRVDANF